MGTARPRGTAADRPLSLHRARTGPLLAILLGCLPLFLVAQGVEEPDWTGAESPQDVVTLEEELSGDLPLPEPSPPPRAQQPPPHLPSAPYQDRAVQDLERRMVEPVLDDPDLGTPVEDPWGLPNFTSAADPFFQMEGLKIRIWEIHLRFTISGSLLYNDNIFQNHDDRVGDYITQIEPTILAGVGDFRDREQNYLMLAYSPQFEFFATRTGQNTVNEYLNVAGQYAFRRLVSTAELVYRKDSNPNEDEIGRNENQDFLFSLDNSYALGTKTFFELGLGADYRDFSNRVDYTTLSVDLAIAYQFSEKTRINLGPMAGITFVDGGGEQPFQGINLGFTYDTLRRLTIRGNLGFQARQFRGPNPSGQTDYVTPVFGIGGIYEIGRSTSVSLDLSRSVGNSGVVLGQSLITNRILLGINQRIFSRIRLSLSARYDILQYQGTGSNNRTDTYLSLRPSIGYEFWKEQCEVSVFYTRNERTSDIEAREFYTNIFGARIDFAF